MLFKHREQLPKEDQHTMLCGYCKDGNTDTTVAHVREHAARVNAPWDEWDEPDSDQQIPAAPVLHKVDEVGMYKNSSTGVIYKVTRSRTSGHVYASRLVTEVTETDEDGTKHYAVTFEFETGAIRSLHAEDRLTLEEAKQFGAQFNHCCVCGALLTNPVSVAAGIGPICGGRL